MDRDHAARRCAAPDGAADAKGSREGAFIKTAGCGQVLSVLKYSVLGRIHVLRPHKAIAVSEPSPRA